MSDALAVRFARLFSGHTKAFGQFETGAAAAGEKVPGKARTIKGQVSDKDYAGHLDGSGPGLGIIMLRDDDTVVFGAIDHDDRAMDHRKAVAAIEALKLPLVLCRSKSGGGHFYCFTSPPVKAPVMRERLARWCALLRMAAKTEQFPKQSSRQSDEDVGSWINLPYFDAERTARYAFGADGRTLTLEEFLDFAESRRVNLDTVEDDANEAEDALFYEGPPCLQALCASGEFAEGERNLGMAATVVYLQKRYPDAWKSKVDEYNSRMAGLAPDEMQHITRTHSRKSYSYQCKQPPINAHCQRDECTQRRYGIGRSRAADGLGKKTASHAIVDIATGRLDFHVSTNGEAFALPREGPKIVAMVRGGHPPLRAALAREYHRQERRVASGQALTDALQTLEGIAAESEQRVLHLRVAREGDESFIDIGDASGRAIRIACGEWSVVNRPGVLFRRTVLTGTLPEPARPGDVSKLWLFLSVEEKDQPLVLAWIVTAYRGDMPVPVLFITGEQGSFKTTASKTLVSVIDPSPVPTRKPPRDAEAAVTSLMGSWVVGFDNVSYLPPWLSDTVCRGVTGEGDVRRKLYTDGELSTFAYRRCLIINAIDLGSLRGDLADRALALTLRSVTVRRDEHELKAAWRAAHPEVLGGLLGLAARVAEVLPRAQVERLSRMADYHRVLAAVDEVMGTNGLARYAEMRDALAVDSLASDEFLTAIGACLGPSGWKGTAAVLLSLATPPDRPGGQLPRGWPATARAVTQLLHRQGPAMRAAGWTLSDDGGNNHDKVIRWHIVPPPQTAGVVPPREREDF